MEPDRLPAGTQWVAFQTLRDLLERDGITIPAPSRVVHYSGLSREALQLGRLIRSLVTSPRTRRMESPLHIPGNGLLLEDALIAGFRRAIDASQNINLRAHRPRHRARARILRAFEAIVEHNLSTGVRMPDLCAHLGTSQRTLENLCNDYYGMPPLRYLNVRRLNAVRHHLLHAADDGASITATAGHFGFRHPGRFSQIYHSLFRELPSHTLKARDTCSSPSPVDPQG